MPFMQVAPAQWPLKQAPEAQSPGTLQGCVSPHFFVQLPPQSTSLSLPFFTMSVHEGIAHTPCVQTSDAHCEAIAQVEPLAHGAQSPPQSTSPSLPLRMWSLQVGAAQKPPPHTWLVQSPATWHLSPGMQGMQVPPQSVSVSEPFFTPSLQVSMRQAPAWQTAPAGHSTPMQAVSTQPPSKQAWVAEQLIVPHAVG
jgi:hypothetical protein